MTVNYKIIKTAQPGVKGAEEVRHVEQAAVGLVGFGETVVDVAKGAFHALALSRTGGFFNFDRILGRRESPGPATVSERM